MATVFNILLFIDGIIYDLICYVYKIFNFLAQMNIFSSEDYEAIVERIYIVLGVVMLFALAYALIRAVINPDDFAKGETAFSKIAQNVVISIVIIAVLPTIFTVAFNIQNAILKQGTIQRLIIGTDSSSDIQSINSDAGRMIAYYSFSAFFHPNPDSPTCKGKDFNTTITFNVKEDGDSKFCSNDIKDNGLPLGLRGVTSLAKINDGIKTGDSFTNYDEFGEGVRAHQITYLAVISTAAGIFILYVLLNFCFDMAVRVIKLMFFQIIAPIPVMCRAIPFGGLKDVFNKWMKKTVSAFLEVFIRIAVMYFGIFMINIAINNFPSVMGDSSLDFFARLIVQALLIMGIVIFIRQAPKLLGDLFGIDSGGMKLGLMDKLAQGGGLAAGAAIAGGAGMLARNLVNGGKNVKKQFDEAREGHKSVLGSIWAARGAIAKTAGSMAAGTFSGFTRAGYGARNAKNFGDLKKSASSAIKTATDNRDAREKYRSSHASSMGGLAGEVQTAWNVATGHVSDTARNVGDWLGINSLDAYNAEKDFYERIIKIDDNSTSVAADLLERDAFKGSKGLMKAVDERYYMSYQGMKSYLEQLKNNPNSAKDAIAAKKMTDFFGVEHTVTNEREYAEYLSAMEIQMGKAKRDAEKYIKKQGYKGDLGTDVLNANDAYYDLIALDTTGAIHSSVDLLAAAGDTSGKSLGDIIRTFNDAKKMKFDDVKGTKLMDVFDNEITINSEEDFGNFLRTVEQQKIAAEDKMKKFVYDQSKEKAKGVKTINDILGSDVFDDSITFTKDVKDIMDTGELQRLAKLTSDQKNVADLVAKAQNYIASLNNAESTDEMKRVRKVDSYEEMDDLTNNAKNRNIAINAEIEKLTREREARQKGGGEKK